MLKIRLQRFGRRHEPTFRVVLTDSRSGPKSGKFLEVLGSHDPRGRGKKPTALKQDRIMHWISKGAQTSDTMHNLLIRHSIIKGEKIDVSSKKKKKDTDKGAGEMKESSKSEEKGAEEITTDKVAKEETSVDKKEIEVPQEIVEKETQSSPPPTPKATEGHSKVTEGQGKATAGEEEKKEEELTDKGEGKEAITSEGVGKKKVVESTSADEAKKENSDKDKDGKKEDEPKT